MTSMQWNPAAKTLSLAVLVTGLTLAGCNKSAPTAPASGPATPAVAPGTASTTPPLGTAAGEAATLPAQPSNSVASTASTPPAPEAPPIVETIPAHTAIPIRTTETLSASHNDVGDRFTGEVAEDVVEHGATVLRRGTRVEGRVVAAKGRGKFKGAGDLGIELTSIAGTPVTTSEYEVTVKGKGKRTAEFAGGGGAVGALIGGLAGHGKGALIGGLAGAGGGTAAGAYTGNKDVVIPSESLIRFRLEQPLTLREH